MYPLLFPNGEEGWFPDIPMANQDVRPSRKVPPLSSSVEVDEIHNASRASDANDASDSNALTIEASSAPTQARFRVTRPA